MDRSSMCARPGCQGAAAAWLTYAYGSSQVWLDDRSDGGGDRWPLCASHAERLKVPRGWSQVDRRTGRVDGRSLTRTAPPPSPVPAPSPDAPITGRSPRALAS